MITTSEPAFPSRTSTVMERPDGSRSTTMVEEGFRGMSLRDYFAGQALAALAGKDSTWDDIAVGSYAAADAMLKERKGVPS